MALMLPSAKRERDALAQRVADLERQLSMAEQARSAQSVMLSVRTGQHNAAVGQVNALTGQVNELTGQVNELTRERNDLVGRVNEVTGDHNELTREHNELTRQRNDLVGRVNSLTGERNGLVGQMAAHHQRLQVLQRQLHASNAPATPMPADAARGQHAATPASLGQPKPRRAKFLIVSNMRCGSTWLQTLLGSLDDVATDYEMKWAALYQAGPGHIMLDENSMPIGDILARFERDAPVVGSKLVLDPVELTRMDFDALRSKLSPDVRIIHLLRGYRDLFLSRRRGAYHSLGTAAKVGAHIKEAIVKADVVRCGIPSIAVQVSPLECFEELKTYLQIDGMLAKLQVDERPYLRIGYGEIDARLPEIAGFIDSTVQPAAIAHALRNPPVEKLPPVAPERLVANIAELDPIFTQFDGLRSMILR